MPEQSPIDGKCILVAEDNYLLAMMLTDDLVEQGARVIGPISSCAATLDILRRDVEFDAAILDINLLDGQIYEAADLLMKHGHPFVFASSVARHNIPSRFDDIPLFFKPLEMRNFFASLFASSAQAGRDHGERVKPFHP
jgi:CheY-like chemotaxis protein